MIATRTAMKPLRISMWLSQPHPCGLKRELMPERKNPLMAIDLTFCQENEEAISKWTESSCWPLIFKDIIDEKCTTVSSGREDRPRRSKRKSADSPVRITKSKVDNMVAFYFKPGFRTAGRRNHWDSQQALSVEGKDKISWKIVHSKFRWKWWYRP